MPIEVNTVWQQATTVIFILFEFFRIKWSLIVMSAYANSG